MATPRLGLVVEDKPTELSCNLVSTTIEVEHKRSNITFQTLFVTVCT